MKKHSLFAIFCLLISTISAQIEPQNGVEESKANYILLTNANVYVSPTKKVLDASILIKNNKIERVAMVIVAPNGAVTIDMKGKTIVPAFIDLNSTYGVPEANRKSGDGPQYESSKSGAYYWNESIHPEVNSSELFTIDSKSSTELIKSGFGFVLSRQNDGISQGNGALVSLGSSDENKQLCNWKESAFFSFNKGVSKQAYPSSQMGSIALLRQAIYDALWYKNQNDYSNISLIKLNEQLENAELFFSCNDELEILRAEKIAEEFGKDFNYLGSGTEYKVIDKLKGKHITIPINFPSAFQVDNPYIARQIPLSDLKDWELAPYNPSILASNNIEFSISFNGNKSSKEFWSNLRLALEHGLSIKDAIRALTVAPAKILGVDDFIGTLDDGKMASFMVYTEDPFKQPANLVESWLLGERTILEFSEHEDASGKFALNLNELKVTLEITGGGVSPDGEVTYMKETSDKRGRITTEEKRSKAKIKVDHEDINIQFQIDNGSLNGSVQLRGKINPRLKIFEGEGMLPNGHWIKWTGIRRSVISEGDKKAEKYTEKADTSVHVWYPNVAYGFEQKPVSENIVIKNATLWTNEAEGIVEKGTIVVENGKISYVGSGSFKTPSNAKIIDANGKHVTSGIIDEHSHIAISRGVNEGGQAISAEVSIGDVLNPNDINIYRQLSGGVTASQLLHGSANPIGGQSALVKLKWGSTAEEMLIPNAPKFIKFALGENVKQTNWGDQNTIRFPQTRMGVEQVYYDAFHRARRYSKIMEDYRAGVIKEMPKRDLELEVLNEILQSERFITCHSYIQSEINMLMHVADSMGFKVNTFTHILEGYKVADKMADHGVGGSTFSDWWAYKYEVNDAIPYNATLMQEQGIVVAINSDDAEMGRRLNQEAAKGIKYGGMTEEEAWKMVTLNPAKLLHLDDRMGSLKIGKDADIVIWTDNPLSITAKVEYTIVDGAVLFDKDRDAKKRISNQEEKARIISKMLSDDKGEKRKFLKNGNRQYHCDTLGEEASEEENHH